VDFCIVRHRTVYYSWIP